MTPSGIEKGPDVTGTRLATGNSTVGGDRERPAVAANCNECNEALDAAREALAVARRIAMVADKAILNGDLHRARAALRDLQAHDPGRGDGGEVHSAHGHSSQDR